MDTQGFINCLSWLINVCHGSFIYGRSWSLSIYGSLVVDHDSIMVHQWLIVLRLWSIHGWLWLISSLSLEEFDHDLRSSHSSWFWICKFLHQATIVQPTASGMMMHHGENSSKWSSRHPTSLYVVQLAMVVPHNHPIVAIITGETNPHTIYGAIFILISHISLVIQPMRGTLFWETPISQCNDPTHYLIERRIPHSQTSYRLWSIVIPNIRLHAAYHSPTFNPTSGNEFKQST